MLSEATALVNLDFEKFTVCYCDMSGKEMDGLLYGNLTHDAVLPLAYPDMSRYLLFY